MSLCCQTVPWQPSPSQSHRRRGSRWKRLLMQVRCRALIWRPGQAGAGMWRNRSSWESGGTSGTNSGCPESALLVSRPMTPSWGGFSAALTSSPPWISSLISVFCLSLHPPSILTEVKQRYTRYEKVSRRDLRALFLTQKMTLNGWFCKMVMNRNRITQQRKFSTGRRNAGCGGPQYWRRVIRHNHGRTQVQVEFVKRRRERMPHNANAEGTEKIHRLLYLRCSLWLFSAQPSIRRSSWNLPFPRIFSFLRFPI